MGPSSIPEIVDYCKKVKGDRKLYVVNTHSHFDHIWGNSAFKDWEIIAHRKCFEVIKSEGENTLKEISEKYPEWIKEEIELVLPNFIFEKEINFYDRDGNVEIKHLPGHTEDSSVIIIRPENILIAGDMVEDPFPLLERTGIDTYIRNLKYLEDRNFSRVIPSHGQRQDSLLIKDNIHYLEELRDRVIYFLKKGEDPHEENITVESIVKFRGDISPFYRESHENNIKKAVKNFGNDQ